MNANFRNLALWAIIGLLVVALVMLFQQPSQRTPIRDISYSELLSQIDQGRVHDVIISGTARRAALGRCEVSLTLDNSSGLLPIETAEVTISRTLYRNGDSEYAINGATCRLLDVQELLSDSGVGRSQHMIIGQNQLDRILNSRPEERRAVIEEAAGVLKHRRRKERAERRLAQTQENLERLGDLVREVRRQMRPLERQVSRVAESS